jgi:hypothetical protein
MNQGSRLLGSFFLIAALAAPLAISASPRGQDRDDRHDRDSNNRVYDPAHHDYHQWNDQENTHYQEWARENHYENRDYNKLNRKEQSKYWNWRHSHPDDHDRDRDHDRDDHAH